MHDASLSFTLRLARTRSDLAAACAVRADAYGHHLPALRQPLGALDPLDQAAGTAVLLCRDKADGSATGTMRIQRNADAPLLIEQSITLPSALQNAPRAEITRLAVRADADPRTRLLLMKASYLHCLAHQVRWMVIGARSDALVRIYRRLGFVELTPPGAPVPLAHAGGLPHHVLAFDVVAAERTWLAARHGLYAFMIESFHPELQLFDTAAPAVPMTAPAPARTWRRCGAPAFRPTLRPTARAPFRPLPPSVAARASVRPS
jgi:hypothetical protein